MDHRALQNLLDIERRRSGTSRLRRWMSPNAFRSVVDIDLLGSYHVLRAAHPLLRKPGAVVINARPHRRPLAIKWGGDGIRVNSVVPLPIEGTEGMA